MAMPPQGQVEFHASVSITRKDLELYTDTDGFIAAKQERAAEALGLLISRTKKCWNITAGLLNGELECRMDLYVFTLDELQDLMDAKFKERMLKLADEKQLNDKVRRAIKIMAERY